MYAFFVRMCVCVCVMFRIFHNILLYTLFYVTVINKDGSHKKKKTTGPKKYLINKIKREVKDQRSLDLFIFYG